MSLPQSNPKGLTLPAAAPRVNWSHPVARGLQNAFVADGSNLPVDLVTGLALNQGTRGTRGQSAAGTGFQFNGTSQIAYANRSAVSATDSFSLFAFVTPLTLATGVRFLSCANGSSSASTCAIGIDTTSSSAVRAVVTDSASNTSKAVSGANAIAAGVPVCLGANLACNGAGSTGIFVGGAPAGTAAATAAAYGTANTTALGGQYYNGAAAVLANCLVHAAYVWNRPLTAAEHELLGLDPTCFLTYPDDELFAAAVGSVGSALAAGSASGTAGSTTASVSVAAASGGTGPYTYQWYRSTSGGFTPGAGNVVAGATNRTLGDTGLTNGVTYYYKNVVTDHVGTTATSNQVSVTPAALASGTASTGSSGSGTASVSVTAPSGGTPPYTYQWYRSTTSGFTPGAGTAVPGATSPTLNDTGLSNGTTYYYVCAATDGAGATADSNQTPATPTSSTLASGTASLTSTGTGTVSVASTAASGGGGAYTYQWYRSTDPSALGPSVPGATSLALSDTGLTNGTTYYYKLQATDGTSTAVSNQVSGVPAAPFYLGVIGDSWTNTTVTSGGTSVSPSASAAGYLVGNQLEALFQDGTQVVLANQGVGGTNGSNWAPGGTNMNAAVAAFHSAHPTHADWTVLVHLGINDSSVNYSTPTGGESKAQYKSYIQAAVAYLLDTWGAGRVVLVGPPNIKDLSANHTAAGVALLAQYFPALQEIAAARPTQVFATQSEFDFFTNNQQFLGGDKVHPTPPDANGQGGSVYVAGIWAKAVYDAARPAPDNGPPYYSHGGVV